MAYDEELAERTRGVLPDIPVTEKPMFGGLAFLAGGNMAVAVSSQGGLMVRCDPAEADALLAEKGVTRMVMRGRELDGWLLVSDDAVLGDATLAAWVDVGMSYAESLPPKD